MTDLLDRLRLEMTTKGCALRMVSAARIAELEQETAELYARDLINPLLHEKYLQDGYDFGVLRRSPEISSLVIAAAPSRQGQLVFQLDGQSHVFPMPPIIADRMEILRTVKSISADVFAAAGYCTFPVVLPKKSLAAHSGLGKYGRNNLIYIPGLGSFHRLTVFATDYQPEKGDNPEYDTWQAPQMAESCQTCTACRRACPTGAISDERFLLHTERCLGLYNEKPGDFPTWVDPAGHNCVVGCLACQTACPQNRGLTGPVDDLGDFTEEETQLLLSEAPLDHLSTEMKTKLARAGLVNYYSVLARNLRVLLAQH